MYTKVLDPVYVPWEDMKEQISMTLEKMSPVIFPHVSGREEV